MAHGSRRHIDSERGAHRPVGGHERGCGCPTTAPASGVSVAPSRRFGARGGTQETPRAGRTSACGCGQPGACACGSSEVDPRGLRSPGDEPHLPARRMAAGTRQPGARPVADRRPTPADERLSRAPDNIPDTSPSIPVMPGERVSPRSTALRRPGRSRAATAPASAMLLYPPAPDSRDGAWHYQVISHAESDRLSMARSRAATPRGPAPGREPSPRAPTPGREPRDPSVGQPDPGSLRGYGPPRPPPTPDGLGFHQRCEIHAPPPPSGALNPTLPRPAGDLASGRRIVDPPRAHPVLTSHDSPARSGGALGLAGPARRASSPAHSSVGDLQAPEKPLCPPGYKFDYHFQACFRDTDQPQPRPPPGTPQYHYACRCKPGESYIFPYQRCWTRGQAGIPVTNGLQRALDWFTPAYKFVDYLSFQPSDYRETLWNFGHTGGDRDPSMRRWFGPYGDYTFELIHWALGTVRDNLAEPFIRCHDVNVCGGAPAYSTGQGYIHLCPGWGDLNAFDTPELRINKDARALFHEMLHFAGIFKVVNFPRDVRHGHCDDEDDKCYGDANSRHLADNATQLRDVVYDQQRASHHDIAACVANVDNYVAWMRWRFEAYEFCAVPPGAPNPSDWDGWPDP